MRLGVLGQSAIHFRAQRADYVYKGIGCSAPAIAWGASSRRWSVSAAARVHFAGRRDAGLPQFQRLQGICRGEPARWLEYVGHIRDLAGRADPIATAAHDNEIAELKRPSPISPAVNAADLPVPRLSESNLVISPFGKVSMAISRAREGS